MCISLYKSVFTRVWGLFLILVYKNSSHPFKKMRKVFACCHFTLAIGVRGTLQGSFVGSQKLSGFSISLAKAEGKITVT